MYNNEFFYFRKIVTHITRWAACVKSQHRAARQNYQVCHFRVKEEKIFFHILKFYNIKYSIVLWKKQQRKHSRQD